MLERDVVLSLAVILRRKNYKKTIKWAQSLFENIWKH